ncbi:MAG TPA: hypothetical protein VI140_11650 [Oxalicibacterium sp.]
MPFFSVISEICVAVWAVALAGCAVFVESGCAALAETDASISAVAANSLLILITFATFDFMIFLL